MNKNRQPNFMVVDKSNFIQLVQVIIEIQISAAVSHIKELKVAGIGRDFWKSYCVRVGLLAGGGACKLAVVYFDQLSGAVRTRKLIKTLF